MSGPTPPARPGSPAPLTPLAIAIYALLVRRLRSRAPTLTYRELLAALGARHPTHPRSARLHAALATLCVQCRDARLPCLPALVYGTAKRTPGAAYFRAAHPRARTPQARRAAWEAEVVAVLAGADRYPRRP